MGKMMRIDVNYKKEDWDLFFAFSMAAAQIEPNDQKNSVLAMEVEPVTVTDKKIGNGQTRDWMLHWEQGQQYP